VTEGIKEIQKTFAESAILVILVVFIFLSGWRATLIPLLSAISVLAPPIQHSKRPLAKLT